MHIVAGSDITARVLAKAHRNGESLREARSSADPSSEVFIDGMWDNAERARERWEPGVTWEWWTTASRDAALAAYIAALECSEIDGHAAAAARQFQTWFATPPEGPAVDPGL